MRRLLEESTGEKTGSVYDDRVMPRGPEGIVVKTHRLDSYRYSSAIHVIRNPFDAIESYYAWRRDIAGENVSWEKHIEEATAYWKKHALHWRNCRIPVYHLHFESLKTDVSGNLRSVCEWLGYDIPASQLKHAVQASRLDKARKKSSLGKKFYRNGKSGKGVDNFSPRQVRFVQAELSDLLKDYGYESMQRSRQ